MGFIDKHFRITDKACEVINKRDRARFPCERDFVNEAIVTYEDRVEIRKLSDEFKELRKVTEKIYKTVGWK